MSTAGVAAAPEMRLPLKGSFLPSPTLEACWSSSGRTGAGQPCPSPFFSVKDPVSTAYCLGPLAASAEPTGHASGPDPGKGPNEDAPAVLETFCRHLAWPLSAPRPLSPPSKGPGSNPEEPVAATILLGFSQLSAADKIPPHGPPLKSGTLRPLLAPHAAAPAGEWSPRPLPPLPRPEEAPHLVLDHDEEEEADREVEFLTSSDTACLLGSGGGSPAAFRPSTQGRRSFRGCGQVNYAYFEATPGPPAEEVPPSDSPKAGACPALAPPPPPPPPPHQLHRRLRRSHSGPAGSFQKPATVVRVSNHFRQVSPTSDDDTKPEVPPRAPIPARALKPDYRRWSAEVASGAYSDEDKPPKVPPREPLFQGDSRTPSPKSLPSYLHGAMPPTQSFAPDPKYVSSKALQRQQSEGATPRGPCILPIIENGRKVSSTHYYLLPERPPYLDKYEKFFQEAQEVSAPGGAEAEGGGGEEQPWRERDSARLAAGVRAELGGPIKRKHFPCVVSP